MQVIWKTFTSSDPLKLPARHLHSHYVARTPPSLWAVHMKGDKAPWRKSIISLYRKWKGWDSDLTSQALCSQVRGVITGPWPRSPVTPILIWIDFVCRNEHGQRAFPCSWHVSVTHWGFTPDTHPPFEMKKSNQYKQDPLGNTWAPCKSRLYVIRANSLYGLYGCLEHVCVTRTATHTFPKAVL